MASILLMEDDIEQAELLATGLRLDGHDVTIALNAGQAWARLVKARYDLLITDIYVPSDTSNSGGGISLISDIRIASASGEMPWLASMPIVVITGMRAYREHPNRAEGGLEAQLGVDAAFTKPVMFADLSRAIDRLVARRPAKHRR